MSDAEIWVREAREAYSKELGDKVEGAMQRAAQRILEQDRLIRSQHQFAETVMATLPKIRRARRIDMAVAFLAGLALGLFF